MIPAIASIDDINRLLRAKIISLAEVDGKSVRNSLSLYGVDLNKQVDQSILEAIEQTDLLILFELKTRTSDVDFSQSSDDTSIDVYKSFVMHVIVYGSAADMTTLKLVSRFRTQETRTSLQSEGIYLESVSESDKLYEFISMTVWPRYDIDINISCRLNISNIVNDYAIEKLSSIEVIRTI